MAAFVYRFESKGIQRWILDGQKLRDLAGGSALVERLTEEASQRARGARILQATSGSMTAVFPDRESLEAFASEWPMWAALRAPGLPILQAWVPAEQGLTELFRRLAQARNRPRPQDFEAGPWVLRAARSGLPAIPNPGIHSAARSTALDVVALAKERSLQNRGDAAGQVVTGGRPWGDFEDMVLWPEGPVAVLHADGSGVGQMLMDLGGDFDRLQRFSEALRESTRLATRDAVASLPQAPRLRARPVVAAGDDLTWIVPAEDARTFASTWLAALEAYSDERRQDLGGDRIVGGAGLALVHRRYPFGQAYDLAEELCSAAKRASKASGRKTSVLAFRRVTTSRVDEAAAGGVAWVVDRTDRLSALESLARSARAIPRGTLRTWLGLVDGGDGAAAEQAWQRAREVADSRAWEDFCASLEAAGGDPSSGRFRDGSSVAFVMGSTGRATPIREALTLLHVERFE